MSNITYNWGSDYILIDLGNRVNTRVKALYYAEFILTACMATILMLKISAVSDGFINWLAAILTTTLYALAAYRFFSRMFFTEKIVIDVDSLLIVNTTPFSKKIKRYEWKQMGPLHYVGKTPKTDHPLKGKSFDYLGFETQEHLIQSIHHEGNLYFNYEGFPVRFARCVYSWDAEEMIQMIKIHSGSKLRLGPEWNQILEVQESDDFDF
jgi:hypothetical protein